MNFNQVIVAGRLTKKPELKALPSGTNVANFSLAVNHVYFNNAKEKVEEVEFVNCVAFAKTAETIAQYCVQGQVLLVKGRLKTSTWTKKDESKGSKTEVIIDSFQFGQKPSGTTAVAPKDDEDESQEVDGDDLADQDIPF